MGAAVRVALRPGERRAWYWAAVVGPDRPLLSVVDLDVPLPRRSSSLELRAAGLWADHVCETPLDHWTLGLEAFAVALDDPDDALGDARGQPTPLGIDLEWEDDGEPVPLDLGLGGAVTGYEVGCTVHGDLIAGTERVVVDGRGSRRHGWGALAWGRVSWTHVSPVGPGARPVATDALVMCRAPVLVVTRGGARATVDRALCRWPDGRTTWREWCAPASG